ncbi:hypothetical protein [Paraglaciecola sp.]|uniref:hypothetical protein n=1 Tax=Paraglaciecola sp. TaxID=1920173 RepID=UPI003EF24F15
MNSGPNFSNYSLEELYDVLEHIDRDKYPERVNGVKEAIKSKEQMNETKENTVKKQLSPREKYRNTFLIQILILTSVLIAGFLPMKGFDWITSEDEPQLYWGVVVVFSIWTIFYINKFKNAKVDT